MTRALWVDAGNGAAGDMLLAALLDAGADLAGVRAGLARLRVEPIEVHVAEVRRHGLRATQVTVRAPETPVRRGLAEVLSVVDTAGLPDPVRDFARATFTRLAAAEARVHGTTVDEVHFHEVGALDAIADVVGCALALHNLDLLDSPTRVVAPLAVGSGSVQTTHGQLPVPVPAVVQLLTEAGVPLAAHPARRELCTPTGAALLVTMATGWGPVPAMTPRAVGVGAGSADPPGHPNVVRVLAGAVDAPGHDWIPAELFQVETTVDDLDPRIWPDLLDELRSVGAADAWCLPALMRKGRPGQVLSILVAADRLDLVCQVVFTQTTTLGVRVHPVERRTLRRGQVEVTVAGHAVRVKCGYLGDLMITAQPEYEEALAVARTTGLPVTEVIATAGRQARAALDQPPRALMTGLRS